jgi:hypothetical protein
LIDHTNNRPSNRAIQSVELTFLIWMSRWQNITTGFGRNLRAGLFKFWDEGLLLRKYLKVRLAVKRNCLASKDPSEGCRHCLSFKRLEAHFPNSPAGTKWILNINRFRPQHRRLADSPLAAFQSTVVLKIMCLHEITIQVVNFPIWKFYG